MTADNHPIPAVVENVFQDAISESTRKPPLDYRRSLPRQGPWQTNLKYKDVWQKSLRRDQIANPLPRRRPSPPMSPILAPSNLYDEFYPWRSDHLDETRWQSNNEYCLDRVWKKGFKAGLCFQTEAARRKSPSPMNENYEYLYVTDMRSTMGKHCSLIFTDSVSWLSKKRCPKRCRVYVIPGVHLAVNDLFKNDFDWNKIAIHEMWSARQNNCKEIMHRHKHNNKHIIRNLIISKSPIPFEKSPTRAVANK